jgi:hypothetical protein
MASKNLIRRLIASRDTNPFLFWLQMWLYVGAAVLGSLAILVGFSN